MKRWKIIDILHSGRKGIRLSPVMDSKYDGVRGCTVYFNIEDLEGLKPFRFNRMNHYFYDYWDTSAVIQAEIRNGQLILETINTIYVLEEIE